jgi:excisionase family DNA binding protein
MHGRGKVLRETENARFYADGTIELKDTPAAMALLSLLECISRSQRAADNPKPPATQARPARALTRKEATSRLGISLSAYKALVAREQLKEFHVGRRRLITEAEVERFLSSQ